MGHFVVESHADSDVREALAATVVKGGWGLREMNSVVMSLEDIFIKLTDQPSGENGSEAASKKEEEE